MAMVLGSATECAADVRLGATTTRDVRTAVAEFARQVSQPDAALIVVFVSPSYALDELSSQLTATFPDCPIIGCTTSGEIAPSGYGQNSLTGFSLSSTHSQVSTYPITSLRNLSPASIKTLGEKIRDRLASYRTGRPDAREFALFLVDGMSGLEEPAVALVHQALGDIPLIGGSAGDDLAFRQTWVLHDGQFRSDTAVLALVSTQLPFESFKTQHFVPTDTKMVITEADPSTRTVYEINGLPAADEYARLIGIQPEALVPAVFSRYPVMLKIGGEYYVRSLQRKNPDGSLTFYCAIDNGLVLTVARGVDLVDNLRQTLDRVSARLVEPQLLIACECVLRRLEVLQSGLSGPVDELLMKHRAIGFHSYGEQFNAIHVNQTFTGVMIGRMP